MGNREPWLENLLALAWRFESYGVTGDLALLDLAELWGLYRFLKRLASE